MEEDFAVYNFDSLEELDSSNTGLNGLYEEDDQGWDDEETFGTLEENGLDQQGNKPTIGRDFDFAGSTSRFLGVQPIQETNSWTNTSQPSKFPSPWSTLDADPLLSSRPLSSMSKPIPQPLLPSVQQQQQAPKRVMRTLEEIEAELRAQSLSQSPAPQPARMGKTLEEVEAEMLRGNRPPQQQQQQQMQQQQQYYSQQGGAYPPNPNSNFPPPQQQPPFGNYPPPGMQGFPPQQQQSFPQQQQQHQQQQFQQGRPGPGGPPSNFPPGMVPPPASLSLRPGQQPTPEQRQQMQQHMQNQQRLFVQHQEQLRAQQLQQSQFPPLASTGPPNMMNTLFPPLPSQVVPVSLEQQLQYLSTNQHAQHPSLTGIQLQALLQQAQAKVAGEAGDEKDTGDDEEKAEKLKQAAAGEELIRNVEERIREHEMIEQKRKVKAAKIQGMAKHNNLMSNSDKDFITRIQVSQLVTDDPYADDFYFHIMAAIKMSRMNAARNAENPGQQGNNMMNNNNQGGNNGNGRNNNGRDRRPTRRENAMNKMAQNVQRLVDSAKQRNRSGQLSIDGALGKIALRTRSAPRQLLQVASTTPSTTNSSTPSAGSALLAGAGLISSSSHLLPRRTSEAPVDENGQQPPLSHREVLSIVEEIYDAVLDLEQLRRIHPALLANATNEKRVKEEIEEREGDSMEQVFDTPAARAVEEWDAKCAELADKLWTSMRVMEPLDISVPHPFISLVSVLKGKRILPRALRHCSPEQTLTLLTLMVATFDTLDTVRDAPLLDATSDPVVEGSAERKSLRAAIETKTDVFLNAIISPVMSVIGNAPLRLVTGMLGLLIERNDILKVVRSKPGVAFLTVFLSRAESLKQATPPPEAQDLQQWQQAFGTLFHALSGDFSSLFPSTRAVTALPFGASYYLAPTLGNGSTRTDLDLEDEPVWRFLAAVAVCADPQEQQDLVTAVRDKVLENVSSAKKLKVTPEVAALKIRNVDLLLNSLGLSSAQLTVED